MKKIWIIFSLCLLMTGCSLITKSGMAGSSENPKRTKTVYIGPLDKPAMQLFFFDDPKHNFSGWSAYTIQYQENDETKYVCDLKYLTKEQFQDKNTMIVDFNRFWHSKSIALTLVSPCEYDQETGKVIRYYRVDFFDTNSDGLPETCMFGWVSDPSDTASELPYQGQLTKDKIQAFKLFLEQIIDYENIEKEFQKWLKENKK